MTILEAAMPELGRIRIGDRGGKHRAPRTLETFRLTSRNKPRLHACAELWGGEVQSWPDAPEGTQWQLITETNSLPIVVPPGNAFSQYDESWQGGLCVYRCNGDFVMFAAESNAVGQPCQCAARRAEGQHIDTVTRLSVILPDIPGTGVWRLDTGSYYAGIELQGIASMMQAASAEGQFITCTLHLAMRRVRRLVDGTPQTRTFPVVSLQPDVTMRQLLSREIPADRLIAGRPSHRPALEEGKTGRQHAADIYGGMEDEAPDAPLMGQPQTIEKEDDPLGWESAEQEQAWTGLERWADTLGMGPGELIGWWNQEQGTAFSSKFDLPVAVMIAIGHACKERGAAIRDAMRSPSLRPFPVHGPVETPAPKAGDLL